MDNTVMMNGGYELTFKLFSAFLTYVFKRPSRDHIFVMIFVMFEKL